MAFAKFNICNPCCTNVNICHPYTVVNITHPNSGASTPTPVDLWAGLFSFHLGECSLQTAIYPSGGSLVGVFPTGNDLSCFVPYNDFLNWDNEDGVFISGYQNGTLIDLNRIINITSSNSNQRFDVPRYTGYTPTHCYSPLYHPGCPCYEVEDNQSSAWGAVEYQIYPSQYFDGCSTGQYFNEDHIYLKCSQRYSACSADICNGTGIDKHYAINLPYCLTEFNASIYDIQYFNNGIGGGVPQFVATYNSDGGVDACSGWYLTNKSIISLGVVGSCHYITGTVYKYWNLPNISTTGCNTYYVPGANSTHLIMNWSTVNSSVSVSNYCSSQTRRIIFDCQNSLVDLCGTNTFTPTVLSDKTGFNSGTTCAVDNDCPNCTIGSTNYHSKSAFAKIPLTCDVTISYPNTGGTLQYNGTLTYENWSPLGARTWVPNPFTIPCGSSFTYNSIYTANSQTVSLSYQGYQLTRCFTVGVGFLYSSTCYQNEVNYGLVNATCVDMSSPCTVPIVGLNGLTKYHPSDPNNNCVECCATDGSPLGTLDCAGGASCLIGITNCNRPASPDTSFGLWKTQSCCELRATFLNSGGTNWSNYCNFAGRPECIYDGSPLFVQTPSSGTLVSDPCNDILSYSLYDINGDLIYTVSI